QRGQHEEALSHGPVPAGVRGRGGHRPGHPRGLRASGRPAYPGRAGHLETRCLRRRGRRGDEHVHRGQAHEGDEDAGRLELVGAGAVGRLAALTSGLLTALLANLGVALLVAVGLAVPGLPWVDSLGLGLGMAAVGCVFAAITALAAQLAGSRRPAIGIVTSVIALAYLLRAVGDAASPGSWA